MCTWNEVQHMCGHVRLIANKWCDDYCRTQTRCKPSWEDIVGHYLKKADCGNCLDKSRSPVPWAYMIGHHKRRSSRRSSRRHRMAPPPPPPPTPSWTNTASSDSPATAMGQ